MKILFILSLLNSIGGNALWLSASPFIESKTKAIGFIGIIAAIRQMSFLFGSILGGIQSDVGRPLRKYLIAEVLIIFLSFSLLFLKDSGQDLVFPIWASLRFFLSGLSSNFSFKIFGGSLKSWSWGSTANMLFIQGSFVFASILAFVFPQVSSDYFKLSIILDILTSLVLAIYLSTRFNSPLNVEYHQPTGTLSSKILESIIGCWQKEVRFVSLLRSLLLVCTGGSLVFSIQLSKTYFGEDFKNFFYLFFFIYGLNAWVGSYLIKRFENDKLILKFSFVLVILSCFFFLPTSILTFLIAVFLFTLGYWLGILSSNQIVLAKASSGNSGKISSSLIFQISVIFSATEVIYGFMAQEVSINQVIIARLSVALIALLIAINRKADV